jgi:hypothetical protein
LLQLSGGVMADFMIDYGVPFLVLIVQAWIVLEMYQTNQDRRRFKNHD